MRPQREKQRDRRSIVANVWGAGEVHVSNGHYI